MSRQVVPSETEETRVKQTIQRRGPGQVFEHARAGHQSDGEPGLIWWVATNTASPVSP
jgi:hypothetical protein